MLHFDVILTKSNFAIYFENKLCILEPKTQQPTTQEPTTMEPTTMEPATQEPSTPVPTPVGLYRQSVLPYRNSHFSEIINI